MEKDNCKLAHSYVLGYLDYLSDYFEAFVDQDPDVKGKNLCLLLPEDCGVLAEVPGVVDSDRLLMIEKQVCGSRRFYGLTKKLLSDGQWSLVEYPPPLYTLFMMSQRPEESFMDQDALNRAFSEFTNTLQRLLDNRPSLKERVVLLICKPNSTAETLLSAIRAAE